jgi:hypothetical protein
MALGRSGTQGGRDAVAQRLAIGADDGPGGGAPTTRRPHGARTGPAPHTFAGPREMTPPDGAAVLEVP